MGGRVRSTCGIMVTQACLWFGVFGNGRTGFESKQRPRCYSGLQCVCLASAAVTEDRGIQVTNFARLLDISLCAAHCRSIVHGQLEYRKV